MTLWAGRWIIVSIMQQSQALRFVQQVLGRPDIIADPRGATFASRVRLSPVVPLRRLAPCLHRHRSIEYAFLFLHLVVHHVGVSCALTQDTLHSRPF